MKTHLILILVPLTLTSCHILKKDQLTLRTKSQKEQLQITGQRNKRSQQSQLMLTDSSHSDFTLTLWPKGKFTFSVAKGFEGEAEKIMIKGKQINQKMVNLKQETQQDSTVIKATYSNEKESSALVKKNKFSIGYNWYWLLLLPIGYVIYRIILNKYSP
jgi:hypothetical protein